MRHARSILFLALAIISVFSLLLFTDSAGVPYRLIPWDFRSLCVPWLTYGWDAIRAGILPTWCPYVGNGVPFFINPQSGIYAPFALLFGPLFGFSFRLAQVTTVIMLLVGGLGAYTLAYRVWRNRSAAFLTGLCFELSSVLFCHMEHLSIIVAYALTPWLFWAILITTEQRSRWGLPLIAWFTYWLATGGYVGVVLMVVPWCAALTIALLTRRPISNGQRLRVLGSIGLAGLLGGIMSAVAWLPFVVHTSEFSRGAPMSINAALHPLQSFQASNVWGILWPFMTEHPLPGTALDISMRGVYFGAVAVALAAVCLAMARGWVVGALLTLAIGSFLMVLGGSSFARVTLHVLLPVFNLSRLPAVDSRGLLVLALCLLAGGGATLVAQKNHSVAHLMRRFLSVLLAFYVLSVVGLPLIYGKQVDILTSSVTVEAICMLLALLALKRTEGSRLILCLAGIVWIEVGYCAMCNFDPIGQPVSAADYASMSRHVSKFTLEGVNSPRLGNGADPRDQSSAEGFIAKTFHANDYNPVRLESFNALIESGYLPWLQNGTRLIGLPPSSKPQDYAEFSSLGKAIQFEIDEFTPNRIRYHVELLEAQLLVFNEIYFPGWRATIDGRDAPVQPLAKGLRSLEVNAGAHDLVFTFRPTSYFVALGLSLAGFAGFFVWLALLRRQSKLPVLTDLSGVAPELFVS